MVRSGEGRSGGDGLGGQPHDGLAKHTFGQPRALASELASVLPSALVGRLDLAGLEIVPGSFIDAELRASHSDILARVPHGELLARPLEPVARLTIMMLRHSRDPEALIKMVIDLSPGLLDVPDADRAAAIRYLGERLDADSFDQFRQRLRAEHPTLEKEMASYADYAIAQFRKEFKAEGRIEGRTGRSA